MKGKMGGMGPGNMQKVDTQSLTEMLESSQTDELDTNGDGIVDAEEAALGNNNLIQQYLNQAANTSDEEILAGIEDKKERKRIMKQAEKELDEEFGDDLRELTFSQGKILIKLVYRETGSSSYDLVAELRGKFRAFFWQAFARIFGFNLKNEYDPQGEDKDIEFIVQMIEAGQL